MKDNQRFVTIMMMSNMGKSKGWKVKLDDSYDDDDYEDDDGENDGDDDDDDDDDDDMFL